MGRIITEVIGVIEEPIWAWRHLAWQSQLTAVLEWRAEWDSSPGYRCRI